MSMPQVLHVKSPARSSFRCWPADGALHLYYSKLNWHSVNTRGRQKHTNLTAGLKWNRVIVTTRISVKKTKENNWFTSGFGHFGLVLFRKGSTGRSREEIWEALYPLLPDRWQTGRYNISHQDLSHHKQKALGQITRRTQICQFSSTKPVNQNVFVG